MVVCGKRLQLVGRVGGAGAGASVSQSAAVLLYGRTYVVSYLPSTVVLFLPLVEL